MVKLRAAATGADPATVEAILFRERRQRQRRRFFLAGPSARRNKIWMRITESSTGGGGWQCRLTFRNQSARHRSRDEGRESERTRSLNFFSRDTPCSYKERKKKKGKTMKKRKKKRTPLPPTVFLATLHLGLHQGRYQSATKPRARVRLAK